MNYIEINLEEWRDDNPSFLEKIMRKLVSLDNSAFDLLVSETKYWWLEYDDEGVQKREIGFNEDWEPIVLAPVGETKGFLIECADNWLDYKGHSDVANENFDPLWQKLWPNFEHLENK